MKDDRDFLGKEPIGRLLLKLALPTVAAQIINMLYNIVDRIYIGHIPGEGAMALRRKSVLIRWPLRPWWSITSNTSSAERWIRFSPRC